MCYVAVRYCRAVQIDIINVVVVVATNRTADIPTVQGIERDVERCTGVGAPIAVDVLGTTDASASRFVVSHDVTYGVGGALKAAIGVETPVALRLRHSNAETILDVDRPSLFLEVGTEIGGKRGFQSGITHIDGERVGIVVDVKQLRDGRLRRRTTEIHLQIGLLIEAVANVERG